MKKHLMIVLLAASLGFTISGCQKQETEETVGIMAETKENLEGMALYSSCPFVYEDSEWELFYVFLDETSQLGVPEADVWVDDQNIFHERYGFQRYDNYSAMVRKHFF